ncbi:MAG: hypothetical protein ACW99X_14965, partial [Candidatus Thorarchaeota archaeon]
PVVFANVTAWQDNHQSPAPPVIYDDTDDGENGEQIPLIAVEEIGDLRLLVAGTTFFSDFDYGKTAAFDNIVFLENFLEWAANRTIGSVADVDEVGPRISEVQFTPSSPENGQDVTVTATVTDPGGVSTVVLQYDSETVTMTASGSDVYTGVITGLTGSDVYTGVITGLTDVSISAKVVANDADSNTAIRAYYTVTWGGGGSTTPPPIDATTMLIIVGGVGVVIVVIAVVVVMKRR